MKKMFLTVMMSSVLLLSGCGQYGGLYLPDTKEAKKIAPVVKKTAATPLSTESVVESDTPP